MVVFPCYYQDFGLHSVRFALFATVTNFLSCCENINQCGDCKSCYVLIICIIHTYTDSVTPRKNENHTCSLINVSNFHSAFIDEQFRWTEFAVFKFCVLHIAIPQYVPIYMCLNMFHFSRILRTIEDPKLTSIFLHV